MDALSPTFHEKTMAVTVDGVAREALVFSPGDIVQPANHAVVFFFHGHGEDMDSAALHKKIHLSWPDAITVYPQGINTPSPGNVAGTRRGWQSIPNQPGGVGDRDLLFFDAMLGQLAQDYAIDGKRIYAAGFSNGAVFSYLLWATRAQRLAAIGVCAGCLWFPTPLTAPRPLLAIVGKLDDHVAPVVQEASIGQAVAVNQAGPEQSCTIANPGNPVPVCTFYPSPIHAPVRTLIHGGAHVYPSWASDEIVRLFKNHALP